MDKTDKAYKRIEELDKIMDDRLIESCTNLIEYLDEDEQEEYHKLQEMVSEGENFKQTYLDGLEQIINKMMTIGDKLVRGVKKEYQEYGYYNAMRVFYEKMYNVIEDEFDMEID